MAKKWIQGAVNPAHKGYCTPMTKTTCTGKRRAFALTMKKHHGFYKKEDGGLLNAAQINVEKNELEVNPHTLEVVRDYHDKPNHPLVGINPKGNVVAEVGNIIIPQDYSDMYLQGDTTTKQKIIAQVIQNTEGGDKMQDGGPINIDSTFNANKNVPFVNKILTGDTTSVQVPGLKGRSTHLLGTADSNVFPQVQTVNGKLTYIPDWKVAYDNAKKTGNYIPFKTEQDALNFTEQYKNSDMWKKFATTRKYEDGGPINPTSMVSAQPIINANSVTPDMVEKMKTFMTSQGMTPDSQENITPSFTTTQNTQVTPTIQPKQKTATSPIKEYSGSFATAFSQARKAGDKTFKWNSMEYGTETADEAIAAGHPQWIYPDKPLYRGTEKDTSPVSTSPMTSAKVTPEMLRKIQELSMGITMGYDGEDDIQKDKPIAKNDIVKTVKTEPVIEKTKPVVKEEEKVIVPKDKVDYESYRVAKMRNSFKPAEKMYGEYLYNHYDEDTKKMVEQMESDFNMSKNVYGKIWGKVSITPNKSKKTFATQNELERYYDALPKSFEEVKPIQAPASYTPPPIMQDGGIVKPNRFRL